MINWKNILRRAEYSLVQLLLTESQKVIKKLDSDIENELRNFGYESRDQVYLGLERKHTDFKKSLEKRRSKKWQRFRELHHQELQTNRSVNEKPQVMLPIANENNHSAVVRASANKDIETSIATENMRGNERYERKYERKPHQKHQLLEWKTLMYLRHYWIIWVRYLKKILQIIV